MSVTWQNQKVALHNGYEVEEALGFITEYMQTTTSPLEECGTRRGTMMVDEILEGKGKPKLLSEGLRMQCMILCWTMLLT